MNFSNPLLPALAAGALLVPALAATAQAQLQAVDLNAPGDGLVTRDAAAGLEFLDITATANLSVNDALQTPFVTQQGFRFGTFAEFQTLLVDAGFTNFTGDFNTTDQAATENLLGNFIGETVGPDADFELGNSGVTISDGFYAFVDGSPFPDAGNNGVVGVDYQSAALGQAAQDQARVTLNFNQFPPTFNSPIAGTLLVRAVPEPSGLLLLGGAGFGLLARRRR